MVPSGFFTWLWDRLNIFATVFLGIFVEAVPIFTAWHACLRVGGSFSRSEPDEQMDLTFRPIAAAVGGAFHGGMIFPVLRMAELCP